LPLDLFQACIMTSSEKAIITPICFISFNEIVAFGRNISTVKPTLKDVTYQP
jgi:hypothetical protein